MILETTMAPQRVTPAAYQEVRLHLRLAEGHASSSVWDVVLAIHYRDEKTKATDTVSTIEKQTRVTVTYGWPEG
jgi:hypothetical protein